MAIDLKHLGRRYGPYRCEVGAERIADYAVAVGGGIPGRAFTDPGRPKAHPWHVDEAAGRASPYGSVIAPPMFAASFTIQPFAVACMDPDVGVDLVRMVHGEQEFVWHDVIRPGDVVETTGEITDLYARGALQFLVMRTESRRPDGRLVVEGIWTAVVRG
jgi:acyl dehydratase